MGFVIVWLALGALVGVFASSRGRSEFGFFLLSAVLSPIIALIILLVVPNKRAAEEDEKRRAQEHEKQLESIKALNRGAQPAPSVSVADEIEKLATLRDKGVLTDIEFQAQKAAVLAMRSS